MKNSLGRDAQPLGAAQVAQVHLAERVPLVVAHAAGRVVAEEHLRPSRSPLSIRSIRRKYRSPSGKHDQLRPARAGLVARGGVLVAVGRLHGDEVFAPDDLGLARASSGGRAAAPRPCACDGCCRGPSARSARLAGSVSFGVPGVAADAVPVRGDRPCRHRPRRCRPPSASR